MRALPFEEFDVIHPVWKLKIQGHFLSFAACDIGLQVAQARRHVPSTLEAGQACAHLLQMLHRCLSHAAWTPHNFGVEQEAPSFLPAN